MSDLIEKVPGGFRVDGLLLRSGKCGCTAVLPCCYSWSKVKRSAGAVTFAAKATGPETKQAFNWGYVVSKGTTTVEVFFEDDREKRIFSGFYPPRLEDFLSRGWELVRKDGAREDFGIWRCAACRWLYKEPEQTAKFDDLPSDWKCPVCKVGKESFEQIA